MHTHNIMFKKMLASIGVTVSINIPDVPYIPSPNCFSTTSATNETNTNTYENHHGHLLTQN